MVRLNAAKNTSHQYSTPIYAGTFYHVGDLCFTYNVLEKKLFYPRDAMLARVLATTLCLCLSQVGVLSKRLNEFGWFLVSELISTYATLCYKEIQVPSNKGTSLWNCSNFGLRKFHHSISIVEACYQPTRERWTLHT